VPEALAAREQFEVEAARLRAGGDGNFHEHRVAGETVFDSNDSQRAVFDFYCRFIQVSAFE
jgi:hypothetical protein